MNVRLLNIEALDAVYAIEQQAHIYPWSKIAMEGAFQHNVVVGLYEADILVGFAIILDAIDVIELLNIAVFPSFQRQGYGRRLLEAVIALAREKSVSRVLLEVRPSNQAAKYLYQDKGFKLTHCRTNYYRNEHKLEDALVMEYVL